MMNLIKIIITLILFVITKTITYYITENNKIPMPFQYRPFTCYKCLSFWSNMSIYTIIGFCLSEWLIMGVGITITILDTIAFIYHEKNDIMTIEQWAKENSMYH